ncbi:MAG TPA: HNH endonuclease, partial [Acidovorax sp.]|nr:HNH endonuclease [Acidovorax sp.]
IWERANGPVPEGKLVYRKCCNNACVCLEHIAVGTRKDWAKARKKAGASKHSATTILALTMGARKRSTAKNSMEKAREVRLLAAMGLMQKQIAEETGVSKDMVSDICNNRSWREYSSPFAGLGAR